MSGFSAVEGGLVAEVQAMPALWAVLYHGSGVTGRVLCMFSLGTLPPLETNVVNHAHIFFYQCFCLLLLRRPKAIYKDFFTVLKSKAQHKRNQITMTGN